MDKDFADWLSEELKKRDWSQAYLAKVARINRQVVSTYINRQRKNPDPNVLRAIAGAFGYGEDVVFRAAGLLDQVTVEQATLDELRQIISQLPPDQVQELIAIGHLKIENARKRIAGEDK